MRLHKKYGLNPTMTTCFFCGEEKGEIALLGAKCKEEAPMHMCIDRVPCEKCKGYMEEGVIFISVRDGESSDNPYRTGKFCAIKKEALRQMLSGDIIKAGICFVEESQWAALGLPTGNVNC